MQWCCFHMLVQIPLSSCMCLLTLSRLHTLPVRTLQPHTSLLVSHPELSQSKPGQFWTLNVAHFLPAEWYFCLSVSPVKAQQLVTSCCSSPTPHISRLLWNYGFHGDTASCPPTFSLIKKRKEKENHKKLWNFFFYYSDFTSQAFQLLCVSIIYLLVFFATVTLFAFVFHLLL